jgi:peroxiredoxin
MINNGETAPAFELPGITDGSFEMFSLTDAIAQDHAVLLLFYPFDFSPVCTNGSIESTDSVGMSRQND